MGSQGLEPRDAKALAALALPPLASQCVGYIMTVFDEAGAASGAA